MFSLAFIIFGGLISFFSTVEIILLLIINSGPNIGLTSSSWSDYYIIYSGLLKKSLSTPICLFLPLVEH